jgi:hypothetical protein
MRVLDMGSDVILAEFLRFKNMLWTRLDSSEDGAI